MNGFAGIAGMASAADEREHRLRAALSDTHGDILILHPAPWLTLGYAGEQRLFGVHSAGTSCAAVYGSAYCQKGQPHAVRVDDTRAAADLLLILKRVRDGAASPLAVLFGSYMAVVSREDGCRVSVAGDPSGNRAPFVALQENELRFASHPLTCARLGETVALDRGYEDFFLIYGFHPDGRTVYSGVRQLAPNQAAVWSATEGTGIRESSPAEPIVGEPASLERKALIDDLHALLLDCMEDQLCRDERVGVLLGGFDSALVAALLQRAGKQVTTYSFRYAEGSFNQPHIDTLQRHLGTEHVWVDIGPELIAEGMRDYGARCVQPTNWLHYIVQTAHVAGRMRADGIRCAYSGDGCDAMFLGYPGTYRRTRIFAGLPRLPDSAVDAALKLLAWPALERGLGHPYRMMLNLLRAMRRDMPERAFLTFRIFDEISLAQMACGDAPATETVEAVARRLAAPHRQASLQRLGYISKGLNSPSRIKQLAVTDIHGVTIHAPYMHPAIRAFLGKIPAEMLREEGQSSLGDLGKGLLIDVARSFNLLPDEIVLQPKLAAIDSPIDHWYATLLRDDCLGQLRALPFVLPKRYTGSLLRDRLAERLYKKYVGSTSVTSDGLSLLLTYASFCAMADPTHKP